MLSNSDIPVCNMEIEEYSHHEPQQIIQLIVGIQRDELGIQIASEDQPDLMNIKPFYQKGNGNFWLAKDKNKIVGTIALIDIGKEEVALRKMFVDRDYRGGKKGVAQALMDVLINWCRSRSVKNIYLGTIDIMKAAHRFYEKNGFQKVKKEELPAGFPLMKVDNVFYKLHL